METFLKILELSGVGKIIEKATKKDYAGGRRSYNPYRLFSTIIYAFSKHSGSVRKIEESINYDLRFIYLMEQERPSYVTISSFLNNVVVNVCPSKIPILKNECSRNYPIVMKGAFFYEAVSHLFNRVKTQNR